MLSVVARGESHRHYGATAVNAGSSRSHTLFRVVIESTTTTTTSASPDAEGVVAVVTSPSDPALLASGGGASSPDVSGGPRGTSSVSRVSYLTLVDLAGSERSSDHAAAGVDPAGECWPRLKVLLVSFVLRVVCLYGHVTLSAITKLTSFCLGCFMSAGARERLREGGAINKSLSTLAQVIRQMAQQASSAAAAAASAASSSSSSSGSPSGGFVSRLNESSLSLLDTTTATAVGGDGTATSPSRRATNGGGGGGGRSSLPPGLRTPSAAAAGAGAGMTGGAASALRRGASARSLSLSSRTPSFRGREPSSSLSPPGAASRQPQTHIPWRNSKLTRLLRHSLGGASLTSVLLAVSPSPESVDETVSTLKFGVACKAIRSRAAVNALVDDKVGICTVIDKMNVLSFYAQRQAS